MSPLYRVRVCVKEVNGNCAMDYKPGDCFTVERFYVSSRKALNVNIRQRLILVKLCSNIV
jgi:uncharacterized repeat protein (TIGR04076 family)